MDTKASVELLSPTSQNPQSFKTQPMDWSSRLSLQDNQPNRRSGFVRLWVCGNKQLHQYTSFETVRNSRNHDAILSAAGLNVDNAAKASPSALRPVVLYNFIFLDRKLSVGHKARTSFRQRKNFRAPSSDSNDIKHKQTVQFSFCNI